MPARTAWATIRATGKRKEVRRMSTTITRWAPFPELELRMQRLLGNGFATMPAADVYETATDLVVELEVPGYSQEELTIEVSDHTLTITGERTESIESDDKSFRLQERLEGEFERRFMLPPETDTQHVKAMFDKGVLEVHAPKLPTVTPHTVTITKK
jgi:HSP20 family protein